MSYVSECSAREANAANSQRQPAPPARSASPLRQPAPPTHSAKPLRQARDCQFKERQPKCAKSFLEWKSSEMPPLLFGTHSPEESCVSECSTSEADSANRSQPTALRQPHSANRTPPTALRQPHSASPLRQLAPPSPRLPIRRAPTQVRQIIPRVEVS